MDLLQSFGIEGKLLLWQIINFGVLFGVLWYLLYKPIRKTMHDREEQIKSSVELAANVEKSSREKEAAFAKTMEEQRRELQQLQTQAIAQQEAIRKELKARADEDARKIIEDARRAVTEEKKAILASLDNDVKNLAVMLAGKILEKEVDSSADQKMLDDALRSFRTNN